MVRRKKFQPVFMPQNIDILHPVFSRWFAKNFPQCEKVVVFDKDETLFTTVNGRRSAHQHLVQQVLFGLQRLKPSVAVIMFTEDSIDDMQMDLQLFPEVFAAFDFIITADNYAQPLLKSFVDKGLLHGEPLMLQLRRMTKPVGEMFAPYPVVLIDDFVGTDWIAAKPGEHGIKPYPFAKDNPANAKLMVHKLVKQLKQFRPVKKPKQTAFAKPTRKPATKPRPKAPVNRAKLKTRI